MTVDELLTRARSAAGRGTRYKLGAGGMLPHATQPRNVAGECDCSGFVCWALGVSRQTSHPFYVRANGGWINTDAMKADALAETGFFRKLGAARAGCIVVYGASSRTRVGHVGIVTATVDGRATRVLHCSSGNGRRGDAIAETDLAVFERPDAVFAWYDGIDF